MRISNISTKLFLMVVALTVPALVVVGSLAYFGGKVVITRSTMDNLTAIRASKASQIEGHFADIANEARILSSDRMVVEAMRDFAAAHSALETEEPTDQQAAEVRRYYKDTFVPTLSAHSEKPVPLESVLPLNNQTVLLQERYMTANPWPEDAKDRLDSLGDGSDYDTVHGTYHPIFREIKDRLGYYDVLLIDVAGNIVYSVSKEPDFATNLSDGPFSSSNLAAAFESVREAEDPEAVHLVDFAHYQPSLDLPAAFIVAPVFDAGRRLGVLAIEISIDEIDRVMTGGGNWRQIGLGESGEAYLVGPDFTMRSNSRFLIEDPDGFFQTLSGTSISELDRRRIQTYDSSILIQEVDTEAARAALAGLTDTAIIDDYRGVPVLTSYAPINILGQNWAILADMDVEEAFAPITRFSQRLALIFSGMLVLLVPISWLVTRRFVAPIVTLDRAVRRFGAGDDDVEVPITSGDELGRLAGSFNTMISSIRQHTADLTRSNEELTSVKSVIVRWGRDGEISFMNKYGLEFFGFAEAEIVGHSLLGTIVPDTEETRHNIRAMFEEIVDHPERYEEDETENLRADGTTVWTAWRNRPIMAADGGLEEILTIGIDVTERRRAEQQVAEQKEMLENTLESLTHPFYVIDADDYTIKVANTAARRLGADDTATCHALSHQRDTPCDGLEHPCPLAEIKKTRAPVMVEHIHRDADGKPRHMEVHGYPIFDGDGRVVQMIEYSLDITERKEMELDLEHAKDAAEAANRAKSAFLANMSHELRTPMNAIIGYSEMLAEDAEDEGYDEMIPDLQKINAAGKHLLALINDILDLSKIEAGRMDLYLERFELRTMLDEASATIAPLMSKNGNRLEMAVAEDLGTVRADLTKLRQALFNLLSNSAKFTENGTVTLAAERFSRDQNDWVRIAVTDSGIGIAADKIEHVFEEFSQADATTTREYGGTGLGLPISRRFCRMMGGDITATSELGSGSTFTIELPAHVDALEAAKAAAASGEAVQEPLPPGSHPILVVDDDADSRELLRRTLESEGYAVVTASGGEEGIEAARRVSPSLITLDVMMPGMDGWAVLKELKADRELRRIPVMMVTIVGEKDLGYSLGAVEHLTKPVNRDSLRQLARQYAGPQGGGRALVVDDDPDIRALFQRALEEDGWTVDTAEHGAQGLEQVAEHRPDLVLLDLMMPVMDGFDFVLNFRAVEGCTSTPIIVITAKDLTDQERQRLVGGVERIIEKGAWTGEQLLENVRALVARYRGPAPGDREPEPPTEESE